MIRAIFWCIYFSACLLYTLIPFQRVKKLNKLNRMKERDDLIADTAVKWGRQVILGTGSTVLVTGEENIPKEGGVLLVANHQSNLDIPLLCGFVPRCVAYIAKSDLLKAPILNQWMKMMGCIFIHRGDTRKSLHDINMGIARLNSGKPLVLFPEGTRCKDGLLQDFKPGSLRLGIKSKVPIVPITISGTYNIMPKGRFVISPTQVKITISPPIIVDENEKDSNKITDLVRNAISQNLK